MRMLSLRRLYTSTQTRFRSELTVAVLSSKIPRKSCRMTLVPTVSKGLLMEYTMCTIRKRQGRVSQLSKDKKQEGIENHGTGY